MTDIYYENTPVNVVVGEAPQTLTASYLATEIVAQLGEENLVVGPQGPAGATGRDGADGVRLGTGAGEAAPGVNAIGRVVHGATSGVARPQGYGYVEWIGSVEPANRATGDTWVRTS